MTQINHEQKVSTPVWRRLIILLLIILTCFFIGRRLGLGTELGEIRFWIEENKGLGVLVFILLYFLAGVAALPGLPLTLAAGALFGSFWGVVYTSIGSILGACMAFLLARTFARDAIYRWLGHKKTYSRIERWTSDQGSLVVILTRLFPIFPSNILHFAFGLTKLRFRTYAFWTWLCMLPGTVFYVSGADAFVQGISEGRIPWLQVGIALTILTGLIALLPWAKGQVQRSRRNGQSS